MWLFSVRLSRPSGKGSRLAIGGITGSFLKAAFMWGSISQLILPAYLPEKMQKMLPVLLMPLILPIRVMPKIKLAQKIRLMKKIRPVRKIPKRPQNRLSLQRSAVQREAIPHLVLHSETVYTGLSPAVVTLLSPVRVQCLIIRAPAALPGLI